ncbi:hypothetical protein [Mycolicibacterium komossense]|uniref:Uncharacterized protein n=1 Tax=Mycolicibacterium komossense TaxID=1779 RepID=A0ABT3C997_9MYCO|nr:hypothetical protein [Mycolicibacterium komossense]MCV7226028.1 hypothetical protein [Mycolicibacterium komossense]
MTDLMHRSTDTDLLHELGDSYLAALEAAKDVSFKIEHQIEASLAAGHSLADLSEASGLSVGQLEYILVSAAVQDPIRMNQRNCGLRAAG